MIDEMFDVVDENDRVTGQALRSVVHAQRLIHRAVHIFVFRSSGELLIHRRAADKEEFPDVWTSSASGHVSAGESYDDAAPRELQEELGISPRLRRLAKFAACPETCLEHTVLYQATCDDSIRIDPVEISAVDWCDQSEITSRLEQHPNEFSPAFRLLFAAFHADAQSQP